MRSRGGRPDCRASAGRPVPSAGVSARDIRPAVNHATCDVCGRTLLRGEHPGVYIAGGERRSVCDLCTTRAIQEGWIREGTVVSGDHGRQTRQRTRSPLARLRAWRAATRATSTITRADGSPAEPTSQPPARPRDITREPRHVRAVPASVKHRVAAAVEAFNGSEHARTIAGVARSLGSPAVSVRPSRTQPAIVTVVASWELCWYRYEIDLSDEVAGVRLAARGSELSELEPAEREGNATADENGLLTVRGPE